MFTRRFKIIYLPEGSSHKREFKFNRLKVSLFIIAFCIIVGVIVTGSSGFIMTIFPDFEMQALTRENRMLIQQIQTAQSKIIRLQNQIDQLAKSDEELRLMADLPLIDPAARLAGVGGSLTSPGIDPSQDLKILLEKLEKQVDLQQKSYPEILRKMENNLDRAKHTPAISPVDKIRITSRFGIRKDPFTGVRRPHKGLDFGAVRGAPVKATADGIVTMVKRVPTFGKVIMVDHGFGYETIYGHLNSFAVRPGQRVTRGDVIGAVGNTGRSTSPHLHYEVWQNRRQVDPIDFIFDDSIQPFNETLVVTEDGE